MSLARIDDTIAPHATMIVKKITMTDAVTTKEAAAIGHAVLRRIQSIAAVAATRRSIDRHAHIAIAARNIAVDTAHARPPERASTTTMRMLMVTENPSQALDVNIGATKTSTVTGHATKIASAIGVTAKTGRRTMTMSVRRTDRKIRIRSVGAAVTATKRKSAITTMISIDHLDEAARTEIMKIAAATTVRQRASVL